MSTMQSYDIIEGFEYWNPEAWRKFIKDYIIPLRNSAVILLKLKDHILKTAGIGDKTTLSEIEKRLSDILPFLLGGIKEDGEYTDNSLAKLVKLTLGIYINPKEWINLEKEEGIRAFDYVYVKNENTTFLEFLKKMDEISSRILNIIGEEPKDIQEKEIEEIIKKPEKMLEIIREIYIKWLQVSANHNYYTFFTISTRTLPFKYMIAAYPKLQHDFDNLKEFLGLAKIFEPKIEEKIKKDEYTVWSHSENGLCDSIYKLNHTIWYYFTNENVKNVFSYVSTTIRNLWEEYVQKVKQKLEEVGWNFPEYLKKLWHDVVAYFFTISGLLLTNVGLRYLTSRGYSYVKRECSISLLNLLDDLSPALFLGSYLFDFELKFSDNELVIERR
jgi:hypothetical protein